MDRMMASDMLLAENAELHRIVVTAETSPSELSAEEWSRFTYFALPRIGQFEYLFIAREDEAISDIQWTTSVPFFADIICRPGYRRHWDESVSVYGQQFRAYVDREIIPGCSSQ